MMLLFIMLDSLALLLNLLAWIIILMYTTRMSLYEALCDTPGDCPKVFNPNFVIGIIATIVYAVVVPGAACVQAMLMPSVS